MKLGKGDLWHKLLYPQLRCALDPLLLLPCGFRFLPFLFYPVYMKDKKSNNVFSSMLGYFYLFSVKVEKRLKNSFVEMSENSQNVNFYSFLATDIFI